MKHLLLFAVLAQGTAFAQGTLNLSTAISVPGKFVVEPAYRPPLPEVFRLTFVDSLGRAVAEHALKENVRSSSYSTSRGGAGTSLNGDIRVRPDGTFQFLLPAGEYTVLVKRHPNPDISPGAAKGDSYYLKSISFGATDLLQKALSIKPSVAGEIVINLAKCTLETQQQCR